MEFNKFPKIPRLRRDMIITEKIDGTNAQVYNMVLSNPSDRMRDDFEKKGWKIFNDVYCNIAVVPASRNRFLSVGKKDNYGFAAWVSENAEHLVGLGAGRHYGEWWGQGIQRNYGLDERRFSLFNVGRWGGPEAILPECVHVVPKLYQGGMNMDIVNQAVGNLRMKGSVAAPGFEKPEGVIVFHTASNGYFKVTCENDEQHKGEI